LKVIKAGMDTRQVLARFEAERQALAVMDHPNIAKVFDAASTPSGRSYFAMEVVHGEPITDYCDRHKLTLEQRLELFSPVCQAVQHAHQKGIIHRDIKPKNVLVAVVDDKPTPKIIDFGVAKAMAQPLTQQTIFTEQGQLIGTPEYMSPEQAEMSNLDIDTRSDIYSLGVLLYELLTGALPFDRKALRQAGFDEVRRIIREVEPPKPSTKISTLGEDSQNLAAKRHTDFQTLRRLLRQELDWIVMKTLEKDRTRRYATAVALAEDVQHYLAHEPVQAGPPGGWYRLRKYVRRYRTPLAITAGFVGLLVAMMILAIRGYYQESQLRSDTEIARQRAESEAAKAKAAKLRADEALEKESHALQKTQQAQSAAEAARSEAVEQRHQAQQSKKATEEVLVDMYTSAGLRADERGDPYEAILWFANAAALSKDDPDRLRANSLRFDAWSRRMWVPVRAVRLKPENPIRRVDFHPGGKFLLIHADTNKRILWDVIGDKIRDLPGGERPLCAGRWNPQGDRLALATPEGQVTLYGFPDGKQLRQFQHPGIVSSLDFGENGQHLGVAGEIVQVCDCQSAGAAPEVFSHPARVFALAFSPRCDRLATACEDGRIRVFALGKPGKPEPLFPPISNPKGIPPLMVNGGKELITVSGDQEVAWWNVETGERLRTESYSGGEINGLKGHPDGNAFAVFGGPIDVWRLASSKWTKCTLQGHQNHVTAVDWFSDHLPDDPHSLLVSVSIDRTVRLWCWRCNRCIATIPHQDELTQAACSRNGCWIATVQKGQLVCVSALRGSPKSIRIPVGANDLPAVSRDGRYLVLAGWWRERSDSAARIYRVEGGEEVGKPLETGGYLNGGAISPQGNLAVTLGSNEKKEPTNGNELDWGHLPGQILFWRFPSGKQCFTPLKTAGEPIDADFSPDGKRLAVVCAEGTVFLIDPQTGRVERKCQGHGVTTAASGWKPDRWVLFSPQGDCFLTVNFGSEVCIRFLDEKKQEVRIKLEGTVRHAEFSGDGKLVVAACDDKVRVFDVLTGKPQGPLLLHPDWANNAHFSSDGRVLLTACRDHMARLWNWRDSAEPVCAMEHVDAVYDAGFSADNKWAITVGRDNSQSVWDCAGGMRVMPSVGLSGEGLQLLFTPDKKRVITPGWSPFVHIFDLSELACDENAQSDGNWRLPWAEIISGRQVKKNGTINLSTEEWHRRWRQFNNSFPQILSRIIEERKQGNGRSQSGEHQRWNGT
jgi:eukaryotic-like serine/threonine-protein kinase